MIVFVKMLAEVRAEERTRITRGLRDRQKRYERNGGSDHINAAHELWQASVDIDSARGEWMANPEIKKGQRT